MSSKDNLGDKLKYFEGLQTANHAMKGLPLLARLDGRSFSKFTKGLKRPFDERMSALMQETTSYLINQTNAITGYTQSDEITLVWYVPYESESEYMFGGKYQKLVSTLSALATAFFNKGIDLYLPEKSMLLPTFDCRVWQVPTTRLAYLNFLWREQDATKNSISMAARHYFSHKELISKNSKEKMVMLETKGVVWGNYPDFFKRGSYFQRETVMVSTDTGIISRIPSHISLPDKVQRTIISDIRLPPLASIANPEGVLLFKEKPILKADND